MNNLEPNYTKAVTEWIKWSISVGTELEFAKKCKTKSRYFPKGFDLYSVEDTQAKNLQNFLQTNSNKNPKLDKIINHLNKNLPKLEGQTN
jgi:hypothetical protein